MKKQIVAAAVAATMSAVALADIAITGAAKVNFTNTDSGVSGTADTNVFTQEMDLKVKGKSGDTEVVINFGGGAFDGDSLSSSSAGAAVTTKNDTDGSAVDARNQVNVEDAYVKTKVGDVAIQAGTWDSGNNVIRASSRKAGKFKASTSVAGLDVYVAGGSAGASQEEVGVSTDLGGVNVAYVKKKAAAATNGETFKASTTLGGINIKYHAENSDAAASDRDYVELSGKFGDVAVKVGQATADASATIQGDDWMGDFESEAAGSVRALSAGQDVTAIELATSVAGNKVTFRNIKADGVAGADTDWNKIIVNRPLASGATFELTYTMQDDVGTTNDADILDLELAVSF
jgi:hypothetical protein